MDKAQENNLADANSKNLTLKLKKKKLMNESVIWRHVVPVLYIWSEI